MGTDVEKELNSEANRSWQSSHVNEYTVILADLHSSEWLLANFTQVHAPAAEVNIGLHTCVSSC